MEYTPHVKKMIEQFYENWNGVDAAPFYTLLRLPECPTDILKRVIGAYNTKNNGRRAGYSDAQENVNCPPEALKNLLDGWDENMNDDFIYQIAALNPNCPVEKLIEIVDGWSGESQQNVVAAAILNKKTPIGIFQKAISKWDGKNYNYVIECLRDNPNCPPKLALRIKMGMDTQDDDGNEVDALQKKTKPSYKAPPKTYKIPSFKEWIGK